MECEEYKKLLKEYNSRQEEWAYFAYDQNKALRGMSDRRSKQMARDAKAKMTELQRRMAWHREACDLCKQPPGP